MVALHCLLPQFLPRQSRCWWLVWCLLQQVTQAGARFIQDCKKTHAALGLKRLLRLRLKQPLLIKAPLLKTVLPTAKTASDYKDVVIPYPGLIFLTKLAFQHVVFCCFSLLKVTGSTDEIVFKHELGDFFA